MGSVVWLSHMLVLIFWQFKTMQMMYETIYKALQEAGLDNKYEPQDYLNFFCLGNREIPDNENVLNDVKTTGENKPQVFFHPLE